MEEDKKKLSKDGRDFKQYPPMHVAKIYHPIPNQTTSRQSVEGEMIPIVKRWVEIATTQMNLKMEKMLTMETVIDSISDIDWDIKIYKHQIHLPSNHLMVSGKLIGDIQYTDKKDGDIFIKKIYLPWKSSTTVQYTYPPMMTRGSVKQEHLFQGPEEKTVKHHVQTIYGNEFLTKIELDSAQITTADDIELWNKRSKLHLYLDVLMGLRIWQNQIY